MDIVKEGMQEVAMEEEVTKEKINWKTMIFCCDSYREQPKEDSLAPIAK